MIWSLQMSQMAADSQYDIGTSVALRVRQSHAGDHSSLIQTLPRQQ